MTQVFLSIGCMATGLAVSPKALAYHQGVPWQNAHVLGLAKGSLLYFLIGHKIMVDLFLPEVPDELLLLPH